MVAFNNLFKLSLILCLISNHPIFGVRPVKLSTQVPIVPATCSRIECPNYDTVHAGNGYEIRRYNSPLWMSTDPINDISFVKATRIGFLQLFDYIQGKNNYTQKIEMTGPVMTEITPSDGPFCTSSFIVSFYIPKANQANPPPAKGLHVQKWGPTYMAVRQFGGFVTDSNIGVQAAVLYNSLSGTVWSAAIEKSHEGENTTVYTVAQYNSPFELVNRVNEIWLMFSMEDEYAI